MQQRRLAGLPAIIVIENIDEFAKRDKQTLIYTLLDLMHKPDMFITLVCTSHCFNLHMMLEKRVMSRLNAQFVFITPATAAELCHFMGSAMTVTQEEFSKQEVFLGHATQDDASDHQHEPYRDSTSTSGQKRKINSVPQSASQLLSNYSDSVAAVFGRVQTAADGTRDAEMLLRSLVKCFFILQGERNGFLEQFMMLLTAL